MIIPVYEVATLKELSGWFGRTPSSILIKLLKESLTEEDEVMRKSCGTWLVSVRFALKFYAPVNERPVNND